MVKNNNELIMIPKIEKYIEYMLTVLLKLPRTEKFSIGTEIKTSMYEMLKNVLLASKIDKNKRQKIIMAYKRNFTINRRNVGFTTLKNYTKLLKENKMTLPEIQRSIAGWLSYVKHANSYNLRKSMFYIEG